MQPRELAMRYMEILFGGGPYDALTEILAENCSFAGPFFSSKTAAAYIESLNADPPQGFSFSMIREYSDDSSACLIYRFTKPGISTLMAQIFEVDAGKIQRISLIFDSRAFA